MTGRERIALTLDHAETDHVPICDAVWTSTVQRWYAEGLPPGSDVADYFEYEMQWLFPDNTPQYQYRIIEETDEYIIEVNSYGETFRNFKNRSTTPQILANPVKSRKDWYEIRDRLRVNERRGISPAADMTFRDVVPFGAGIDAYRKNRLKGRFMTPVFVVGFDLVQRYVGMERLLMAIIDDPGWVREMFYTNAQFVIELYEYMVDYGYSFDGIFIADDLGYKNSLLFSPAHYRELLFDADKLLCDYFHDQKLKVLLHSCGHVKELIPSFIEAGIDCLQPLEVKAGMDLIELKKTFGESLAFMGGIDTRLYAAGDAGKLENEIKSKLDVAKKNGGYIYHCDHSVPDNVGFSQYEQAIYLVKKHYGY
jgi:uroporphyrinogen decarboxylase